MEPVALLAEYGTRVVGIGLLAAVGGAVAALVYRLFTRERLGRGVSLLVGLSVAALYLNARAALGDVVAGETTVLATGTVAYNLLGLGVAAAATPMGHALGDRLARDLSSVGGARTVEGDVGRFARRIGRAETVTVPEEVGDIDGCDPVPEGVKAELAGTTLVFPRDGDVAERLVARLKSAYGVAYVDAEFDDGDLAALSVGARQAGLGPTLAPGAVAVAVTADPPNAASAGDLVQVYRPGTPPERLATAEVRAAVGDVVTLACEAPEAAALAGETVRLATLPAEPRPEREFASLLRAADETMAAVDVEGGSGLDGLAVGAVDATVVAIRDAEGAVAPIPSRSRALAAGETVYLVARPEAIRLLEDAARAA